MEILERTKTVTGTYALYLWNRVTLPDQEAIEEWSAEFHSGDLHRVETPRDRVIANCREHVGAAFSLVTGEITEGPQIAGAACGIDTNASIVRAKWLGPVRTPFGEAQRVLVADPENVRQYDVSDQGVLLGATYRQNQPGNRLLLTAEAVKLEPVLPGVGMFDRESLRTSFVPDAYKVPPAR